MAEHSLIEWTDATWNIVTGCSVISPGCTNCYAMRLAGTRLKHHPSRAGLTRNTKAGPVWTGETRVNWEWIEQPLAWTKPRAIFVCAHGDLFHESVAWEDIAVIYGVMIAAHHLRGHVLQVLTKRPARARELLSRDDFWDVANAHASAAIIERVDPLDRRSTDARATCDDYGPRNPPPGIWFGISVEDQRRADDRILHLLATPATVRWLSCEPLLGPVFPWHELTLARANAFLGQAANGRVEGIDWVIAGGESGPGARPMHLDWARSLRDQCAAVGVPFHFKQWGAYRPCTEAELKQACGATVVGDRSTATYMMHVGKKAAGRLLDGVEHNGMPA